MAVAVQSTSTRAWANGSSVVLTKPTGLTVGDLLIVHIGVGSGTVTTLAGWTQVRADTLSGETMKSYIFRKIADSSDVAAVNFTFTLSGSVVSAGAIYRIDGHPAGSPIYTSAFDDDTNASPPTLANTVTPSVPSSMLILLGTTQQVDTATTVSGYAVTTSSPVFTEAYDFNSAGGSASTFLLCGAYGIRTQTTATGNSTWNYSSSTNPDTIGQILVISPSKDFTVSDTITATDSYLTTLGIWIRDTITATDTFASSVSRIWTKLTRNIKSWINQNRN